MLTADHPALLQLLQWTAASKTEVATIVYMLNKALEGYIQVIRQKIDSLEPYTPPTVGHNSEEQRLVNPITSSIDQSAGTTDAEHITGDVSGTAEDRAALAVVVVPTVPEHPSMPLLLDMFNIHKTCSKRMSETHRQEYEQLFIKLFQRSELCLSDTATVTHTSSSSSRQEVAAHSETIEHPLFTTTWSKEESHTDTTASAIIPNISTVLKACSVRWSQQAGRGKMRGDKVDGRRKKKRKVDSNTIAAESESIDAVIEGEATIAISTTEHTTVPPPVKSTADDAITVSMDHDQQLRHEEMEEEENKEEVV